MRPLLEAYFPVGSGVRVIAEPGTFYVSSSFTLAVNVIGKEVAAKGLHGESPQYVLVKPHYFIKRR